MPKISGYAIKAILCSKLKGGEKGRGAAITKLIRIGLKWQVSPMV